MQTDPAIGRAVRHVTHRSSGAPVDPRLRVTVNFHPDRPTRDGLLVVEALARDGEWHSGFRLAPRERRRHPDYRGPRFTALGVELAVDDVLDPRILGAAWRSGRHDDQDLRRVWHLLARFGRPPTSESPTASG